MAAPVEGDQKHPYKGEDRRRVAGPVQSPFGRPYVLALLVIVVGGISMTWATGVSSSWADSAQQLILMLQVASFIIAIAVSALAFSRWYLTSDAPSLWIGVALAVFGVGRLFLAELLPLLLPFDNATAVASWLRPSAQIVPVALLVRAATIVPVSTRISGPRLIGGAVAATAVLSVLLSFVPPVATFIDGAAGGTSRAYAAVNQLGIVTLAWFGLAATFSWLGYRRRRWLLGWLALMLLCLAIGDLVRVLAPPPLEVGIIGKETMRLLGLLLALNGGTREILYTYRDSSTRLAHSEFTAMTAEERIREGLAAAEERAHEARSALAAIEGATRTLEHYRDRLPPETQSALSTAISGEIRRLQRLVSVEETHGEVSAFSLSEALAPMVANERARGVEVTVDVPDDLEVLGRAGATEQVIQTLFDNARRYAPGTPVTVRAAHDGTLVVLRVEDEGPGVPAEQREAIFRRGVRGDYALSVPGTGLGLFVAKKLMQEQGADLWVDERPSGGASFAIGLQAVNGSETPEEALERLEESSQGAKGGGFSALRSGD